MAEKKHELAATYGSFIMQGKVLGCGKENFYKEIKTRTNKDMRTVSFGIQVSKDTIMYVQFNGMVQKDVYFNGKKKDGSKDKVTVEWKNRYTFKQEGYRMQGVNVGLEKITNEKGVEVNDKKVLAPFDAALYVKEHLRDGQSVFVKGNIEYGHYTQQGSNEIVRTVKFIPNQISLCQDVDFDSVDEEGNPNYEVKCNFEQKIVFTGIEKDEEKKGAFIVSAKVIRSDGIEDTTFNLENQGFANTLHGKIKPFTAMDVHGSLLTVRNTDTVEVETDDGWGDKNPMDRVNTPYKVIRLITGADKESPDTENYSEKKIEEALKQLAKAANKEKSFDSQDDNWGSSSKDKPTEEEDTPWD
jgi:hypothetical protein